MSVGSGGIMACDVSLGADQFRLPQQQAEKITGETMPRDSCISEPPFRGHPKITLARGGTVQATSVLTKASV